MEYGVENHLFNEKYSVFHSVQTQVFMNNFKKSEDIVINILQDKHCFA